jgi:hypothetical protein
VTGVDIEEFWLFLERSAQETTNLDQRTQWLEHRLSRVPRTHIVDFQIHLDAARRPVDTYAMWGAATRSWMACAAATRSGTSSPG